MKILNWYKRNAGRVVFRRSQDVSLDVPIVSFSFDDFPKTALTAGGAILESHGVAGTFYASLGLLGLDSPSGRVCTADDLHTTLAKGHELGCHTYAHCHSWNTDSAEYEKSIIKNRVELDKMIPGAFFRTFSYPISFPHPMVKRACAKHFAGCRAGGQTLNCGATDLNQLSAFFLEKVNGDIQPVKDLIDRNKQAGGWIIFATHDISPSPSRFGCTAEFFEFVVEYAIESGARVLPVASALERIQSAAASG